MGYAETAWATKQRTGSVVNKAVLLIVSEAASDRETWISQKTIGERAEASPRAVYAALRSLESAGLIQRLRRSTEKGHRTSDLIRLRMEDGAPPAAGDNDNDPGQPAPRATRGAEPTRTSCRSYSHVVPTLPAPGAKEPVNEPVYEPEDSGQEAFNAWWDYYPKRVKRAEAEKAFKKVMESGEVTLEELISATLAYAESDTVRRGYIAHPTTWLNGKRWTDEHTPTTSGAGFSGLEHALRSVTT